MDFTFHTYFVFSLDVSCYLYSLMWVDQLIDWSLILVVAVEGLVQ